MADDVPFMKQALPQRRGRAVRSVQYAGPYPENACKWRVLNSLFQPGDVAWQAAADADSWDSDDIVKRLRIALDSAWAIEQAQTARQQVEHEKLQERSAKQQQRKEQRRQQARPLKKFLKSKDLVIVRESTVPSQPDPLEVENPLSLSYKERRTRKRKGQEEKDPEASPEPDLELNEDAADHGVQIVSPHKKKRQAFAGVAPATLAAAEQALSQLTPAAAELLLSQVAKKSGGANGAAAWGGKGSSKKGGDQAAPSGDADAKLLKTYYKNKLKELNAARAKKKQGPLNQAGRADLLKFAKFHYKDAEVAFQGSALVSPWWNKYVSDFAKFPAAKDSDAEDTDEEEE